MSVLGGQLGYVIISFKLMVNDQQSSRGGSMNFQLGGGGGFVTIFNLPSGADYFTSKK